MSRDESRGIEVCTCACGARVQIFSVFHYTTDDGNSQYKLIVAYQAFIISESYGDYKMYL